MSGLYQLAALGARMASFNHDIASKVQGLMMALDEIGELAPNMGDPDLARASETAMQALKELHALLSQNRALTKPPVKTKVALGELMRTAGARAGVGVRGALTGDV